MSRWVCPECGWVYDEAAGDSHEGYPPGTPWSALPDDFFCPGCAVRGKEDFLAAEGEA